MSIEATSAHRQWIDPTPGVRFRPRDRAPDPLFGPPHVNYPARDGRAMWDNMTQANWILRIKGGLDALFRDDPDVFVAGNLFWYPVEKNNRTRLAPDAMVIFGRSRGRRESYVQHEEAGIPPQVVFEVLSPSNGKRVMDYKRNFYERYGVQEYYVFDPYLVRLGAWVREGDALRSIPEPSGWVSPRLGVRFELGGDLTITRPNGRRFETYLEIARRADDAVRRADRLAARLRAMGLDPDE